MSRPPEHDHLHRLEEALRPHANSTGALTVIGDFLQTVKSTQARMELFNTEGALVTRPISCDVAMRDGIYPENGDYFHVLAGDVISSDAVYHLGERVSGEGGAPPPKFIVASATCDLVPGRKRQNALLFEVHAIRRPPGEPGITAPEMNTIKSKIGGLLAFKERQFMYLPPLPGDGPDVLANVIDFDSFATARIEALVLANRLATLSLCGWRIFSALLRVNLTREGADEAELREHFGKQNSSHYTAADRSGPPPN